MSDNLKYNEPGTGPNVATDDVGSVHFQKMKLDGGADGVSIPLTGTTTFGILSDVSRIQGALPPGNSPIGTIIITSGAIAPINGLVFLGGSGFVVTTTPFSGTIAGATTAVSGEPGLRVRVLSMMFTCDANVSVGWRSNAVFKIPPMPFAKNGGPGVNFGPQGYIVQTDTDEHLLVYLASNANVIGILSYIKVPPGV